MGVPRHAKEDALALEPRREIYELVRRTPGVHLRGIERELGLPFGQVLYHLDYLERSDMLDVRRDGGFKRYFARHTVPRGEKTLLATFRHELPRRIAVLLLLAPGATHGELHAKIDVSASTLSFHLARMVENGVVERREGGNEKRYRLVDERAAARMLVLHRVSFRDEVVDRFAEYWLAVTHLDAGGRASRLDALEGPLARAASAGDLASSILGVVRASYQSR